MFSNRLNASALPASSFLIDTLRGVRQRCCEQSSRITLLKTVTVILPVYNEARIAGKVFDTVHEFAGRNPGYEFLFVDDGSSDGTGIILREKIQQTDNGRVRLHSCTENHGKGHAVKVGVAQSDSDLVCFTDGDMAYSLDHLPNLVEALQSCDMAAGCRNLVEGQQRNIQLSRRIMGWTFNRMVRVLLDLPYSDTQAGLKGFRREPARRIFACQQVSNFCFDAELFFLARRFGYRVVEIPAAVDRAHAYQGSKVRLLRDPFRMFFSLLKIRCCSLVGRYG